MFTQKGQEEQEEEDVYLSAAAEEDASRRDPFTRRQLASEQAELSKKSDLETCLDYVDMALTEFLPGIDYCIACFILESLLLAVFCVLHYKNVCAVCRGEYLRHIRRR